MARGFSAVLIVDDDPEIVRLCRDHLAAEGYDVDAAGSGAEAMDALARRAVDVVLLDVGLPDADGFELASRIREVAPRIAVFFVTGRDAPQDRVAGLELGAEYLTKPFDLRELSLRLGMLSRREAPHLFELPPLSLDLERRRAFLSGRPLPLTGTEFSLLLRLARTPGLTVSFAELSDAVWPNESVAPQTLMTHISALRCKLGEAAAHGFHIESRRGIGYLLIDMPRPKAEDG